MILRNFYDDALAQASYLVGCTATGRALVIDPIRKPGFYIQTARSLGFQIVAVAETHIHADYLSGGRELAAKAGAQLFLSDEGGPDWLYDFRPEPSVVPMKDGHLIELGSIRLRAIHTPGHTPEHMALLLTDHERSERPHSLFSGDLLFVGDVGRPDLLEKAANIVGTMETGARQLYASLRKLDGLDDSLLIWPGHGAGSACGKALGGSPVTTLGYERATNWAFQIDSESKFVDEVLSGQPDPPPYFAMMNTLNRRGPAIRADSRSLAKLTATHGFVLDVRLDEDVRKGYVPGSLSIPLYRNFVRWAGWFIGYDKPLTIVASSQDQADEAAARLALIGLDDVTGWMEASALGSLQTVPIVPAKSIRTDDLLIDVRAPGEWLELHATQARNIPLAQFARRLSEVPREGRVVVHCAAGGTSPTAVSLLLQAGYTNVCEIAGGMLELRESRPDLLTVA